MDNTRTEIETVYLQDILTRALSDIESKTGKLHTLYLHEYGGVVKDIVVGMPEQRTNKWKVSMYKDRQPTVDERENRLSRSNIGAELRTVPFDSFSLTPEQLNVLNKRVPLEPEYARLNGVYETLDALRSTIGFFKTTSHLWKDVEMYENTIGIQSGGTSLAEIVDIGEIKPI